MNDDIQKLPDNLPQGQNSLASVHKDESTDGKGITVGQDGTESAYNEITHNRQSPLSKLFILGGAILILLIIFGIGLLIVRSKLNDINNISILPSSITTRGWHEYYSPDEGIEFYYPDVDTPNHLTDSAAQSSDGSDSTSGVSDAPKETDNSDGSGFYIDYPNLEDNGLYVAQNQGEGGGKSDDLAILISGQNSQFEGNGAQQLAANDKSLITLKVDGNTTYKLGGDGYYYQCSKSICSNTIQSPNKTFPYYEIQIYVVQGGYAYASIDTHSHNYDVMKEVLKTINFFAAPQINPTQSNQSTIQTPTGTYAPGYTPPNDCYKFQDNAGGGLSYDGTVVSIDASSKTISVQDKGSYVTTYSYTIPSTAGIYKGTNCNPDTFDAIKIGDGVTVYSQGSSSNVINVYDKTN